jgi:hypothetical protein
MGPTTISRDPFARTTLERLTVQARYGYTCTECGRHGRQYRYATVPDSVYVRGVKWSRPFCGVACYRAHTS